MKFGTEVSNTSTSSVNRGIKMDIDNLNKSTCEEIFGGELDVTKEFEVEKPQAWQYRDCLVEMAAKKDKMIRRRLRKRS